MEKTKSASHFWSDEETAETKNSKLHACAIPLDSFICPTEENKKAALGLIRVCRGVAYNIVGARISR